MADTGKSAGLVNQNDAGSNPVGGTEDQLPPAYSPEDLAKLLARRVASLHTIRDMSGNVGFYDENGKMVCIKREPFEEQLAESLLDALTRKAYWSR